MLRGPALLLTLRTTATSFVTFAARYSEARIGTFRIVVVERERARPWHHAARVCASIGEPSVSAATLEVHFALRLDCHFVGVLFVGFRDAP